MEIIKTEYFPGNDTKETVSINNIVYIRYRCSTTNVVDWYKQGDKHYHHNTIIDLTKIPTIISSIGIEDVYIRMKEAERIQKNRDQLLNEVLGE